MKNKNVNINCMALGTFLKDEIASYPLEKLRQLSPLKRITTIDDISWLVCFLISDWALMINGQAAADGEIDNTLQETLV
jgi:enoyl-[acyl-carrier-protein] reductase (NADH)